MKFPSELGPLDLKAADLAQALSAAEAQRSAGDRHAALAAYRQVIATAHRRREDRFATMQRTLTRRIRQRRCQLAVLLVLPLLALLTAVTVIAWPRVTRVEGAPGTEGKDLLTWLRESEMWWLATHAPKSHEEEIERFRWVTPDRPLAQRWRDLEQAMSGRGEPRPDASAAAPHNNHTSASEVTFHCPGSTIDCSNRQLPDAAGPARPRLFTAALASLEALGQNCAAKENLLERYKSTINWRKSERYLLGQLAVTVMLCYKDANDIAHVRTMANYAMCTDDINAFLGIMNIARSELHLPSETDTIGKDCILHFADYFREKYETLSNERAFSHIPAVYRSVASNCWDVYKDVDGYVKYSLDAERLHRRLTPQDLEELNSIHVDRLEVALIKNDIAMFDASLDSLKANPTVSDSRQVIIAGLKVMISLRASKYKVALGAVNELMRRYDLVPEYVVDWSWIGTQRWFKRDRTPGMQEVNEQILKLSDALDGEKTQARQDQLYRVQAWIAAQVGKK